MSKLNDKPFRLSLKITSSYNPGYVFHGWFRRLENFKTYYLEWDKRLKIMIIKDLKNKKQDDFDGIPYAQFIEELHNKMYGSLIASISADIEFDLSTMLGSSSNISKIDKLKEEYLKKYQIDITKINNYEEIERLRKCTNDFKHNANVPRGVSAPYCTSFGNTLEIDHRQFDIPKIIENCQAFFEDLRGNINLKLNSLKVEKDAE
ncbi:MAG: hypothetical protein IKV03_01405 [Alphaproteobacteria bacterium]|nr:hypothetical protein [Alphaproteobacteria bacterium]